MKTIWRTKIRTVKYLASLTPSFDHMPTVPGLHSILHVNMAMRMQQMTPT